MKLLWAALILAILVAVSGTVSIVRHEYRLWRMRRDINRRYRSGV
jgi:hypothetical protein